MQKILMVFFIIVCAYSSLVTANSETKALRITLQPSVISLDPGGIQDSQSWVVSRQVNCQLVRSQGSIFVLEAAESIKYINPLKIILKINNDAKFHDGSPVTAEDVLASFDYIKRSRNILNNLFTWIDEIEKIDDKTIVFKLKTQVPQFLKVLSSTNYTIFKKEFLDKAYDDKSLWKSPLGCGGYKVAEFKDDHIRIVPITKGLPIIFYISKTSQIEAKELSKYDIVTVDVINETKEDLRDFNALEIFDPAQFFIGLNSNSKLWKNNYERCQFLSELNIDDLLLGYGKKAIEAKDLLPKGTLGYDSTEKFNTQIKTIAKNSKNFEVNTKPFCLAYLTVSIQEKYKNKYLNMVKKIYPDAYLEQIQDVKKFGKDFINKNCDALLFAWKSNYLDGYEYLTMFENNDANFSGIYDKEISEKILKSQSIPSAIKRAKEYQGIIQGIGDFCIIMPLLTVSTKKVYIRKNLKTPGIGLISIHQYYLGNISTDL